MDLLLLPGMQARPFPVPLADRPEESPSLTPTSHVVLCSSLLPQVTRGLRALQGRPWWDMGTPPLRVGKQREQVP